MQPELIHTKASKELFKAESILSFQPFYAFVEKGLAAATSVRKQQYLLLHEALKRQPQWRKEVTAEQVHHHTGLPHMIYAGLTNLTVAEDEHLWAMGPPLPGSVFYGTDAFYKLIHQVNNDNADSDVAEASLAAVYSMLLQKCYGFTVLLSTEIVYSFFDQHALYRRHYEVIVNDTFIAIEPIASLPRLAIEELEEHHHAGNAIPYLLQHLPLNCFRFTGFSVITLHDITAKQAARQVRNVLLQTNTLFSNKNATALMGNLQSIVGCSEVEFGFFPFVELNGKLLLQFDDISQSLLAKSGDMAEMEAVVLPGLQAFIKHPSSLFIKNLKGAAGDASPLVRHVKKMGYASFAVVPLYDNHQLVGAMEIGTHKSNLLTPVLVAKLDPVLPHIAQLMKRGVDNFHRRINQTIRELFTAIQPAVEWKFKEAARTVLLKQWQGKAAPPTAVYFDCVFPLYGAIDIKDSTGKRAEAKTRDLTDQLNAVWQMPHKLKGMFPDFSPALVERMAFLKDAMDHPVPNGMDEQLVAFFQQDVNAHLKEVVRTNPDATEMLRAYFEKLDSHTGLFFRHQENTEAAIKLLNETTLAALAGLEADLQQIYPAYFESFRSDGVSYDVYAGPSITPATVFDESIRQRFRFLQLQWMINITRRLSALQLPEPLETTQLIYVHEERIDIGYRESERRFDVSNPYHIRYQVIKKRLDKAELSGTGERLTQPGKIAIVFSKSANNANYFALLKQLQEEGLLVADERIVQVKELAGIGTLEAIQVSVNLKL